MHPDLSVFRYKEDVQRTHIEDPSQLSHPPIEELQNEHYLNNEFVSSA